ncbi:MAG: TolC family protein [Bacteroidales bacterium]|nr:TolC family protein [Bacteroidales bacterium]
MRKLFSLTMLSAIALWGVCASARTARPLQWLFERADSLNTSLQASRLAVESARSGEAVARNAYLPSVDVSLSLSYNGDGYISDRNFSNGFKVGIPSFGNNFKLEVSQVIFAGGAISHGVALAELGTEIATFKADKNRNEVRFLIAGDYIELCKLSGQLKVVDANIDLARQVKERMEVRAENGVALKTDLTRLDLLIENLSYSRIRIESAMQIVSQELCNALKMDTPPAPAEEIGPFHPEGDWMEMAFENAPALKLADAAVQMSAHKEKIARASRLPQIALFAGEYLDGPIVIDIPAIDKNFNYWAVGIGIRYNLANLYKSPKAIRQSHLEWQKAQAQLDVAKEQMTLSIGAASTDYRNAFILLDTKMRSVALAQESYDLMCYRYEEGLVTVTDLLDASSQLLDAQIQEVNARMNIAYNDYKLQYIAGTI